MTPTQQPDWVLTRDKVKTVAEELEDLTPKQRRDTIEALREIYCLECGCYTYLCNCSLIDRW